MNVSQGGTGKRTGAVARIGLVAMAMAMATAVVTGLSASSAAAAITPVGLVTQSASFSAAPGQTTVQGSVTCPAGTSLVAAAGGGVILDTLRPVNDFVVFATGHVTTPTDALIVTATCVPFQRLGIITAVQHEFPSNGQRFRHGFLQCPAGYYAFAGGGFYRNSDHFPSTNGHDMVSNAPSADGTGWTFAGTDNVLSDTMVINTRCAQMASPRRDLIVQAGAKSIPGNFVGGYADCPAGWTAISGGVYLTNLNGSEAAGRTVWSVPATRAGGISSWFAFGMADSSVNTKTNTLAQCII